LLTAAFEDLHIKKNSKNHKKVVLFSSTLTHSQCDAGKYHLFMIFAVFMCKSLNAAVNKCINSCFFTFITE